MCRKLITQAWLIVGVAALNATAEDGELLVLDLPEDMLEKIYSGNALRLAGLETTTGGDATQ